MVYVAAIVVLAIICAGLIVRGYTMRRALRLVKSQLRDREVTGSTARIGLKTPQSEMESLLEEINLLLERGQAERVDYRLREEALREQIANVSHDLRTPLTSILGYLQLLEGEGLSGEERQEYLAVIEGRARTLQTLITSFYDLSRIEGGEYPMERERLDLYHILSELLAEFYGDFESSGLTVDVALQEGLPLVWGDRGSAVRVFTNLIGNALKYGRGTLSISMERTQGGISTRFTNDAPDLVEADVAHIFERFYTADKTRTGGSSGLGMAIIKGLTEQMGHQVRSELKDGRFTVEMIWKMA